MYSVAQVVIGHAERRPEALAFRAVSWRGGQVVTVATRTWSELADGAARVAGFLAAQGVSRGDVVVLMGTHHPGFYACWLGCVWLGAAPTVLAEPSVRVDRSVYWSRLQALLVRIDARVLLTDPAIAVDESWPRESLRFNFEDMERGAAPLKALAPGPDDLLLLQHSSGTTGLNKGVMLSHGAVMRHTESYRKVLALDGSEVFASWLPLYHDMGLIACFVTPLVVGLPVIWLSPFEWVTNPGLLLHAITEWRATHVWLPNFAFSFMAQRVREPSARFSLASLRAVVNCSEPVTAEAMDAFADRFAADGFSRSALHACYAMAETVFAVSASAAAVPSRRRRIARRAWLEEHVARPTPDDAPPDQTVVHVSNGLPVPDCEVRIGPLKGGAGSVGPWQAGRIWVKSTFLFDGYFRRPEFNASLFDADGFFDTGDLGYLDEEGHLYVTGRLKDLVIVGGRNVYPHDVEAVINEVPGVHPGRAVAFGVPHRGLATEGIVVLMESSLPEARWPAVVRSARAAVPSQLDLDLLDARVVPIASLRKSTAGKLARAGNREWYLEGRFGEVPGIVGGEKDPV